MSELTPAPKPSVSPVPAGLVEDLRQLIALARYQAAAAVNAGLTLLYWKVGERIRHEVLGSERAGYGEQIVATLSHQLSWSHFRELLPLSRPFQREFYAEMCRVKGWSVRTLRGGIDSMLYERAALSRKPDELAEQELALLHARGEVGPALVLKDPYILDFLDLKDHYLERDFEDAILRELELFLLELGAGFSFIARQKRIQLDGEDFFIDLLFYNRKLRRLVAVELKQGAFKAEYKGQMELYLRWLAKYEREGEEGSPLGIILCAGASSTQIELPELDGTGIHVAEYLTVLPSRDLLERKLEEAIATARTRFESRELEKGSR